MANGCQNRFLNLSKDIFMEQPEGFIIPGEEHKVCKLSKSIYGLKQASKSQNKRFDQVVKTYGFEHNPEEACVYKKESRRSVVFLVLYVDDTLLIGNDNRNHVHNQVVLSSQFSMKDLGEASYIVGIKLL